MPPKMVVIHNQPADPPRPRHYRRRIVRMAKALPELTDEDYETNLQGFGKHFPIIWAHRMHKNLTTLWATYRRADGKTLTETGHEIYQKGIRSKRYPRMEQVHRTERYIADRKMFYDPDAEVTIHAIDLLEKMKRLLYHILPLCHWPGQSVAPGTPDLHDPGLTDDDDFSDDE